LFEPGFDKKLYEERDGLFQKFHEKAGSVSGKKLYFLHMLFPHRPYRYLPSGLKYDHDGKYDMLGLTEKSPREAVWGEDDWLVKIQNQKFLSQVAYTDYMIGKLLDQFEENNALNPTLFIVAADHGVNLKKGGFRRKLMTESIGDIAPVPLFIKLPGQQRGVVSDLPATLLDVLPTVADILNINVPWKMSGRSLFKLPFEERQRVIHDLHKQTYTVPNDLRDELLAGVKRKHDFFGDFKGWDKFRLQSEASQGFMDRPVSKFLIQAMDRVTLKLDSGSRVEKKPGFLPAIVQGQITGIENREEWMSLVSVNGVFRAVSPVIKISGEDKIFAFLPEIAFKEGSNDVEVFLARKPYMKGGEIFKPKLN
jgi:hypothetical protein